MTAKIGQYLGVDDANGGLLPDEKAIRVREARAKHHIVAMVGDGIKDAPALVEANVGIAMGSGTDVARESADVILIGSDLSKFVDTLRIARRCRTIIMQNFVGTLVVESSGLEWQRSVYSTRCWQLLFTWLQSWRSLLTPRGYSRGARDI